MRIAVVLVFAVLGAGCQEKSAGGGRPAGSVAPAAPASTLAIGAPGGGDRSGSSIANALPLAKDKPIDVVVPCKGARYVGPFTFTHDPQTLTLSAEIRVVVDKQICAAGQWVDAQGHHIDGDAGLGCTELKFPVKKPFTTDYSPGNGGSNVKTVYVELGFGEAQPDGCDAQHVRLSMP